MSSKNRFELTPEQLALAEERRLKRLRDKEQAKSQDDPRGKILGRAWWPVENVADSSRSVKVMTWNMLAQCLVRRELFPTSHCLKAAQREHMLYREITSHTADICCLQEVDRTEKLFPMLQRAGYAHVYKAGPRKKHGSVIAYRQDMFEVADERIVSYDTEEIRTDGDERGRRGSSFFTKNIGNVVALKKTGDEEQGFIVATTHLFWHPRYTYERARQTAILFREVSRFREQLGRPNWPCIVAGDFNFQPDDAAYSLLVGDPLLPRQAANLAFSRVVHRSVDPSVPVTAPKADAEDEEGAEAAESDPDKIITNARAAAPEDGLLSDEELRTLFERAVRPVSAYDEALRNVEPAIREGLTFGSRTEVPAERRGAFEPVWTSYTHYWKTVLDYIFVLDPPDAKVRVSGLACPIPAEKLEPGLPQTDICGSDHISLCANLIWPSTAPQASAPTAAVEEA